MERMLTTGNKRPLLSSFKVKDPSKKDFGKALQDLMVRRDMSYPRLSAATKTIDPNGKGVSHAYLHRLAHGAKPPPPPTIAMIAAALRISPEYFREYRQHIASQRARLLADEIGLPQVLAALDALEAKEGRDDVGTDS